ncbi:MAG TPA: MFS transporter [Thermopolyspora sp.]|jgi:hypothetical protein
MRARLPFRLARSAAFAVVCVTLAAVAHWLGDGSGVRPSMVLAGGAVVLVATFVLADRERSPVLIGGFLIAAQVFLHEVFAEGGMPGGPLTHLVHGQGLSVGFGMGLAHLTATLITACWLARGEALLWTLLRRVGMLLDQRIRRLLPSRPGPIEPARPFPMPACRASHANRPWVLRHSLIRRGPPVLSAF